ncbi:RagB/SusD family nutrient uptake outer membrane protein, partial [Phocaeicola vulgatus]
VNSPELFGPRNSRYEVANFIINDLKSAYPNLPQEKNIGSDDKGKVSQEAAKAFLARVLLHEATWEKYVPEIGYNLDGDGTSQGAGTAKPEGYLSTTDMLTQAKQMAKEVIDEANAGTFQLWNECDSLSYYYLFNIDEKGGNICNFKGAGKNTNKEFIFSVKYDFDTKRPGLNLSHIVATRQGAEFSAIFGESFLCRNGLPIRISHTGNMTDAQNNPDFAGWETFYGEYRNRDYRFIGCTFMPDRPYWSTSRESSEPCTELGKPYPNPVYPEVPYNPNDPAFSSKFAIYTPTLYGGNHNSYGCRKFMSEGANRADNNESFDFPLIRLAEVYLIYAEAACELGNGKISDEDLNFSINNTRKRAGIAPLTNALIANVWDAGYWDHEQNKTVCKKMNMLDEIRRERACELFGEGFREDDLKRWGIAHINLTGQKLGRHVYNTAYMTGIANNASNYGEPVYQPDKYPLTYGVYEGSGPNDPDYGRSIANLDANLLYSQRDYLAPIPLGQIRLNPQLIQNPGW